MNERSIGWNKIKLGLLGDFSKGSGITKNDLVQDGLPCVRYAELYTKFDFIIPFCISFISEETAKTAKPIQKGDILFAGSGETKEEIGKCAVYLNDCCAYAGGDNIIFRTKQAEPLYLSFYLNTLGRKQLNKLGQGDSIVHIHSDDLKNVIIPLPPLPEQEKIAEILGTWDTAIEKLTALIEQKKQLKKGLMQRLLTGKQRLPGFSAPWKKLKLGDFLEIKHGKNQKAIECQNGIFPILATGGEIGRTNTFIYDKPSVLIGRKGTINKPQYIETPFWTVDTLFWSKMKETNIAKFFYYLFQMIKWEVWDEGSTIPSLNASTIMSIKIKISDNVSEQKAIADILSKADEEIALLTRKLSALKTQKTGLMQKLLTGQIRVKAA